MFKFKDKKKNKEILKLKKELTYGSPVPFEITSVKQSSCEPIPLKPEKVLQVQIDDDYPDVVKINGKTWVEAEGILELIDNYAETRHTCGHWTYNLKSNESRQKVIAALKGNDLS